MQTRATRIDTEMVSAFSDGTHVFRGLVSNISKTGLKITDIPSKFIPATKKYATIVSSTDHKFKFKILPVWFDYTGHRLEIGFKIVSPPAGWLTFLEQMTGENV
ncbi:MAG: hypothetical protein KKD73_01250 [Proteobacteria bacterium]|nr:hypothetical protein [Pseudomonadota bacterium]MBU1641124.1 hypothetical protein [Pseudomonadota bacterium]